MVFGGSHSRRGGGVASPHELGGRWRERKTRKTGTKTSDKMQQTSVKKKNNTSLTTD